MADSAAVWQSYLAHPETWKRPAELPPVLPSVFADEFAKHPAVVMPGLSGLGFNYCTPRFLNLGADTDDKTADIVHVEDIPDGGLDILLGHLRANGLAACSLGGRAGKMYFRDKQEVSVKRQGKLVNIPWLEYWDYVKRSLEVAQRLGTRLYRGFSGYPPEGEDRAEWRQASLDFLGTLGDLASRFGVLVGIEIETNLVFADGYEVGEALARLNHPSLGLVFDAGNMRCIGYSSGEIAQMFQAVLPHLLWVHLKDYSGPVPEQRGGKIDEGALKHFVPITTGQAGHHGIFDILSKTAHMLIEKLKAAGLPGLFLELEPHLKGGGQFGGFSGPDGIGVAARALIELCGRYRLNPQFRTFADVQAARGF